MNKLPSSPKIDLSVIILNYNTKNYLTSCLDSISKSDLKNYNVEILIPDNSSSDNSFTDAENQFGQKNTPHLKFKFIPLQENKGFAAGNNAALSHLAGSSPLVLFLNPDTTVEPDTFSKMISFFNNNSKVDAATCYITLAVTGRLQPESHRGFPTPLNTFWHFFGFGLPKLFPKSKIFNGYFMGHLDYSKVQKIEACVGAFLMVRRSVGDAVGWWNEKYFFYGEDLDFCYKLHQKGYSLYFNPDAKITHYQGISSGIKSHSQKISQASRQTKLRTAQASTNAMKIFYQENLINNYPKLLRGLVWAGIGLLEQYRLFKARYL